MEDFAHVFEEPADFRPPTPPPSEVLYRRQPGKDIRNPTELHITLVGHHSLWAHVAWNAGIWMANYIDRNPELLHGKRVLELGAGAALPSMISALNGASRVVATDYPELAITNTLAANISSNVPDERKPQITSMGYLWGSDISPLLEANNGQLFDVIILCDLVFNHSQHTNMLETCRACLADDGLIYCAFTHHRPWMAEKDMQFIQAAASAPYNFHVEKLFTEKMDAMFEKDPGDLEVRQTVHVYCFRRQKNSSHEDTHDDMEPLSR